MKTVSNEIYFMGTCIVDVYYPNAGLRAIEILQSQGFEVIYPKNQSCCGQPAFNSGYRDEAREVARSLLQCFPRDLPIVIPSGSCAGMMRHYWPELFAADKDEPQAMSVANRVFELTEFLVMHTDYTAKDLGKPQIIAVHTSCSSRHQMQISQHIETLLAQLENVTVIEQQNKAECCGFGGTFAIKQPDISGAMVGDKCDALQESGAMLVVTQECGCLMNIDGALKKQKANLPVQHIAEYLWERTHD